MSNANKPTSGEDAAVKESVRLVLAVARLGETDLAGWWHSHGLDRAGSYVLSRAFPRTWRSAALEIDVVSAGRRHDNALSGRRTALHLFSHELPFRRWTAAWLSEQKTAATPDPIFDVLASWDVRTARATLVNWAGEARRGKVMGDGLLIGELPKQEIHNKVDPAVARQLAATYLAIDGQFRAPYFDLIG